MIWLIYLAVYGIAYLLVAVLTYSAAFALFQRKWPGDAEGDYLNDQFMAVVFAIGWPLLLPIVIWRSGFFKYGFKWR